MIARIRWLKGKALPIAGIFGVMALGYVGWHWSAWRHHAVMASALSARLVCSCHYIDGRDIKSCKGDLAGLKGLALVRLSDVPGDHAVRASVPLLASAQSRFEPGHGCLPDTR